MLAGNRKDPLHDATREDREDCATPRAWFRTAQVTPQALPHITYILYHIISSVEVSAKLLNEVANHYVYAFPPYCELKLNTGSRIAWKRPER